MTEISVPEIEIMILKLSSGDELIASMDKNESYGNFIYLIMKPALVTYDTYYDEDRIFETLSLREWSPLTDQKAFTIKADNVITICHANELAINKYLKFIENAKVLHHEEQTSEYSSRTIH